MVAESASRLGLTVREVPANVEVIPAQTIREQGYRTVSEVAHIDADVVAHTIIISGKVNGRLTAEARIVVQQTANVEGDLSAPGVKVDDGALLHGRVEVAGRRQLALAG